MRVGAFSLSRGLIGKIDVFQPLSPREVPHGKMISIHNRMFYHTMDQFHPKVGDVRVQFSYAGLSGKPHSGLGDPMKYCSPTTRWKIITLSHKIWRFIGASLSWRNEC